MRVFVDTSALLAVLDRRDAHHPAAREIWARVLGFEEMPLTSNYVLVEINALLQARFGLKALRIFESEVLPALETAWVDEEVHQAGKGAVLAAGRRGLSLVDCVSFEVMRRHGIQTAFAFDRHFAEQGFSVIPR
jgi:predicted nucleic acid-binding protein